MYIYALLANTCGPCGSPPDLCDLLSNNYGTNYQIVVLFAHLWSRLDVFKPGYGVDTDAILW